MLRRMVLSGAVFLATFLGSSESVNSQFVNKYPITIPPVMPTPRSTVSPPRIFSPQNNQLPSQEEKIRTSRRMGVQKRRQASPRPRSAPGLAKSKPSSGKQLAADTSVKATAIACHAERLVYKLSLSHCLSNESIADKMAERVQEIATSLNAPSVAVERRERDCDSREETNSVYLLPAEYFENDPYKPGVFDVTIGPFLDPYAAFPIYNKIVESNGGLGDLGFELEDSWEMIDLPIQVIKLGESYRSFITADVLQRRLGTKGVSAYVIRVTRGVRVKFAVIAGEYESNRVGEAKFREIMEKVQMNGRLETLCK